jgi:hypothetical protein
MMAIVKKPREVDSQHFPRTLKYLVAPHEEPPQLTRAQEEQLRGLGTYGWRAYRARRRKAAAEQLAEKWRKRILKSWPKGLVGIRVHNRHSVQVRVATQSATKPAHNQAFLDWLGKNSAEVVNEFALNWERLLASPRLYRKFTELLLFSYGSDAVNGITIRYNRTKMFELIEEGKLPPIPEGMFETIDGGDDPVRRLLVERIDNQGKVIREPKPDLAA